jgi:hypothetical protein
MILGDRFLDSLLADVSLLADGWSGSLLAEASLSSFLASSLNCWLTVEHI